MAYNEETVTENLLLELAERHSGRNLEIRSYTKPEEGTGTKATNNLPTGADWAFWFGDTNNKGIELRIQAKRLFNSGKYESLDGNGQQIEHLMKNCGSAIPLYVFYNSKALHKNRFVDETFFGNLEYFHNHHFHYHTNLGCTFAPVTSIPQKNKPLHNEINRMYPWHVLVCHCQGSEDETKSLPNLPHRIASSIQRAYNLNENGKNLSQDTSTYGENIKLLQIHSENEAPEWVRLLHQAKERPSNSEYSNIAELDDYLEKRHLRGLVSIREIIL